MANMNGDDNRTHIHPTLRWASSGRPQRPVNRGLLPVMSVWVTFSLMFLSLLYFSAHAGTYTSAVTTFNWIDPSTHTQVGATTTPYKFNSGFGCATSLPTIDDNISDKIPMGFNFLFGDKVFNSVRINSNGRIHLVNDAIPWDNTTCGAGSAVTQLPFPNAGMNYVMRLYGNDLDPTPKRSGYTTVCADGVTAANNPCYVSFATIGTAPNRRFVVSWKGVPEWVSTGAKGAYDIQIIIQENGEFIYQYGPYVAGPAAKAAQIGYQLSTTNYDVAVTGFPAQNFAIRYFVPHPLTEYLMEQSSWSDSGSVLDTSGSNNNGSPVGTVSTVGSAKVCRGADIPSNAAAATVDAINTGMSVPTQIGNAGTIAFWYKSKTTWNSGNAQLLDATESNSNWFFLTKRSTAKLRLVIRDSAGNDRVVESTAITTSANTWRHVAVTWNFNAMITANNNKLTIYVDGVQKGQTTFTSSTTAIGTSIGSLYIGDNRSSFIEATGTGNSANGVIDEVRIYNYELSQQGVASLMNLNSGCLDHYAISSSGAGMSCIAVPITLSSHTSTHDAYINNNLINLSTSDNQGDWSLISGHGSLTSGPANSGTATYQFSAESQVVLGLLHSAGTVTTHASDSFASDAENGPITITSIGCAPAFFDFNSCELSSPRCTPASGPSTYANLNTKLANTSFAVDLVALKANGTLETSFSKPVSVNLLANTSTPMLGAKNCPVSSAATIPLGTVSMSAGRAPAAGVSVAANAISSVTPGYSAYRDVRVQIVCNSTNCPPSGLTACSSDAFAIRPSTFTVASSANADATGLSATATPIVKTGVNFSLTATAVNGYNGTPTLDISKVQAHPGALQAGSIAGSFGAASAGFASSNDMTYSEAGYFRLAANGVTDNSFASVDASNGDCTLDYSNSAVGGKIGCYFGNETATGYFGRFVPDHFDITPNTPAFAPACGSFSYLGQPFGFGTAPVWTVTARNSSGAPTRNYTGSLFKLSAGTITSQAWTATSGAVVTISSLPAVSVADIGAGQGTLTFGVGSPPSSGLVLGRVALAAPFNASLTLSANVADSEGIDYANNPFQHSGIGFDDGNPATSNDSQMRFGRLRIANANGSELLALPVPLTAQYWNGLGFVSNPLDNCTSLATPTLTYFTHNTNNQLTSGETSATLNSPFVAGVGGLNLSAPGNGNYGYLDLAISAPDWLKYNWDGVDQASDGNLFDDNPRARATFGKRKGADKVIIRREIY